MSRTAAPATYDCCRARIGELLDCHADMVVVEHTIAAANALDSEEKDALWLWASGRRDRLSSSAPEPPIIGRTAATEAGDPSDTLDYPKGVGHD
jgi:hypothetical protein